MHTYVLYICPPPIPASPQPPPNKFTFRFTFLSFNFQAIFIFTCLWGQISLNKHQKDFYGFYLELKTGLHFSIHNNKCQCNSFFCTKREKFWDFAVQKNFCFLSKYATLKPPFPPCTQSYAFGLTSPLPPLYIHTM